jgi:dsDNA-binding SOS-regulon protein
MSNGTFLYLELTRVYPWYPQAMFDAWICNTVYPYIYSIHHYQEEAIMAVEIKYVVVRGGVEKMTFASKKEADAYDKLLDTADELMTLLAGAPIELAPEQQESLAFYLAEQRDVLQTLLRGGKVQAASPEEEQTPAAKRKEKPLKQVA